ncbi:VOC family protein [Jannaschia formosa]|uniref:VOC family protein n=1 Tax=Jannaschia formosa TaxID=2259592 RepID=UPI000E1C2C5D|nr:VOC family protein [Jannaschia formosa]TFL18160.1 glyoxalase [Jannaschia formosa]
MTYTAPAATGIGHVHLRVKDLERAIAFYRDVMGFELQVRMKGAAFLGAGGYHHHIGLNDWNSAGGPPPRGHSGLFHTAFLYPTMDDLKTIARRVRDNGVHIYGHADHGVSVALYFDDPDGNGIEIYWDRPREDWPRDDDGNLILVNDRFDLGEFLAA